MANDGNSTALGRVAAAQVAASAPKPTAKPTDIEELTADISARLRRVCTHLPNDEFAELVLDIARVRMRYDEAVYGRVPRHTSNGTA